MEHVDLNILQLVCSNLSGSSVNMEDLVTYDDTGKR